MYTNLKKVILQAKQEAVKENKPLVVVIGEDHRDRGSMLAELMVLKIASDEKIGNLLIETDQNFITQVREDYKAGKGNVLHVPEIIADADAKGIKVKEGSDHKLSEQDREKQMIQSIQDAKEHSLFLVGNNHLFCMLGEREELSKQAKVLLLNLSNLSKEDVEFSKIISPKQAALSTLLNKANRVFQADLGEEFERMPKREIIALAAKVTQQDDLPKKLIAKEQVMLGDGFGGWMERENTNFVLDPPMIVFGGNENPAADYRFKQLQIIHKHDASKLLDQLSADKDIEAAHQESNKASDAVVKLMDKQFKEKPPIDQPNGLLSLSPEDRKVNEAFFRAQGEKLKPFENNADNASKRYDALFKEKLDALGVKDEELRHALEAGVRFHQNDKKYGTRHMENDAFPFAPSNFLQVPLKPQDQSKGAINQH